MKKRKLFNKILQGSKNIHFHDFVNFIEGFGFNLIRTKGSHHIYGHDEINELIKLETLSDVEIAKALWIETAKKEGKPIPSPKYTPVIYQLAG